MVKPEYIGAGVALVAMIFAARWSSCILRRGYRIMQFQGVDTDMRIGWRELRRADVSICRQYAIGLTLSAICGIVGVILLVLGWFIA